MSVSPPSPSKPSPSRGSRRGRFTSAEKAKILAALEEHAGAWGYGSVKEAVVDLCEPARRDATRTAAAKRDRFAALARCLPERPPSSVYLFVRRTLSVALQVKKKGAWSSEEVRTLVELEKELRTTHPGDRFARIAHALNRTACGVYDKWKELQPRLLAVEEETKRGERVDERSGEERDAEPRGAEACGQAGSEGSEGRSEARGGFPGSPEEAGEPGLAGLPAGGEKDAAEGCPASSGDPSERKRRRDVRREEALRYQALLDAPEALPATTLVLYRRPTSIPSSHLAALWQQIQEVSGEKLPACGVKWRHLQSRFYPQSTASHLRLQYTFNIVPVELARRMGVPSALPVLLRRAVRCMYTRLKRESAARRARALASEGVVCRERAASKLELLGLERVAESAGETRDAAGPCGEPSELNCMHAELAEESLSGFTDVACLDIAPYCPPALLTWAFRNTVRSMCPPKECFSAESRRNKVATVAGAEGKGTPAGESSEEDRRKGRRLRDYPAFRKLNFAPGQRLSLAQQTRLLACHLKMLGKRVSKRRDEYLFLRGALACEDLAAAVRRAIRKRAKKVGETETEKDEEARGEGSSAAARDERWKRRRHAQTAAGDRNKRRRGAGEAREGEQESEEAERGEDEREEEEREEEGGELTDGVTGVESSSESEDETEEDRRLEAEEQEKERLLGEEEKQEKWREEARQLGRRGVLALLRKKGRKELKRLKSYNERFFTFGRKDAGATHALAPVVAGREVASSLPALGLGENSLPLLCTSPSAVSPVSSSGRSQKRTGTSRREGGDREESSSHTLAICDRDVDGADEVDEEGKREALRGEEGAEGDGVEEEHGEEARERGNEGETREGSWKGSGAREETEAKGKTPRREDKEDSSEKRTGKRAEKKREDEVSMTTPKKRRRRGDGEAGDERESEDARRGEHSREEKYCSEIRREKADTEGTENESLDEETTADKRRLKQVLCRPASAPEEKRREEQERGENGSTAQRETEREESEIQEKSESTERDEERKEAEGDAKEEQERQGDVPEDWRGDGALTLTVSDEEDEEEGKEEEEEVEEEKNGENEDEEHVQERTEADQEEEQEQEEGREEEEQGDENEGRKEGNHKETREGRKEREVEAREDGDREGQRREDSEDDTEEEKEERREDRTVGTGLDGPEQQRGGFEEERRKQDEREERRGAAIEKRKKAKEKKKKHSKERQISMDEGHRSEEKDLDASGLDGGAAKVENNNPLLGIKQQEHGVYEKREKKGREERRQRDNEEESTERGRSRADDEVSLKKNEKKKKKKKKREKLLLASEVMQSSESLCISGASQRGFEEQTVFGSRTETDAGEEKPPSIRGGLVREESFSSVPRDEEEDDAEEQESVRVEDLGLTVERVEERKMVKKKKKKKKRSLESSEARASGTCVEGQPEGERGEDKGREETVERRIGQEEGRKERRERSHAREEREANEVSVKGTACVEALHKEEKKKEPSREDGDRRRGEARAKKKKREKCCGVAADLTSASGFPSMSSEEAEKPAAEAGGERQDGEMEKTREKPAEKKAKGATARERSEEDLDLELGLSAPVLCDEDFSSRDQTRRVGEDRRREDPKDEGERQQVEEEKKKKRFRFREEATGRHGLETEASVGQKNFACSGRNAGACLSTVENSGAGGMERDLDESGEDTRRHEGVEGERLLSAGVLSGEKKKEKKKKEKKKEKEKKRTRDRGEREREEEEDDGCSDEAKDLKQVKARKGDRIREA
ncbi:UNVERIFIED_CONTAM: hypothetical protein HHA_211010 [Hammondia hammondi]|eukprot:XP_008885336.1 hypothetical protein HHA_211010 [Hammondia hammondi]